MTNPLLTIIAKIPRARTERVYLSARGTEAVEVLAEVRAELRAKPIARMEKQLRANASGRRRGEDLRKREYLKTLHYGRMHTKPDDNKGATQVTDNLCSCRTKGTPGRGQCR